jgi:type I restriction enzyme S subunit
VYEQKHAIKNDFEIGEYFVNEEKFFELKAFELKPRDIIISCSGTIGKIAVAPHNIIPGIINQALLKISLNEDEIEIPFFTYWFNNYVNNGSLSTKGAAIKNIVSVKELKTIPIKVPNLNKQKEICDKLDRYLQLSNQTQSKLEGQLAYLKQLKSSILSKAFKGEL